MRYAQWEALSAAELQVVRTEAERCREDFTYAARNYFWITTKKAGDQLMTLLASQELVLQAMQDLKNSGRMQKVMILKARQLGVSTLMEALGAWRTIFFRNQVGMVISYEPDHAALLFQIMTRIFDMLPWWLQPLYSSMEFKTGLIFENPDRMARGKNPGLNSRMKVEWANKMTGIGQGYRLSFVHASEYCDYGSNIRSIIEGDINNALAEDVETMAGLESTADRAGSWAHSLWRKNIELGERADWTPIFLPAFFEKGRSYPLPSFWEKRGGPEPAELKMRDKVREEWLQCDNAACETYLPKIYGGRDRSATKCTLCDAGNLNSVVLTDGFLYWMEVRRINSEKDEESVKELRREQCMTAEEAWTSEGLQLFSAACQDWVSYTVRSPIFRGMIDNKGNFHGMVAATGKCASEACELEHLGDDNSLRVWAFPVEGAEYCIGVDVAEGLGGNADYSVVFVNRIRRDGSGNDEQVAVFRSNEVDPIGLAYVANALGRRYNMAMIAVELNKFDTCATFLRINLMYENLYQEVSKDGMTLRGTRLGFNTNVQSKPRLYTTAIRWLKANTWTIRSVNFLEEMKTFNKESSDSRSRSVGAGEGFNDDELMAGMISLYCAHVIDFDENLGFIPMTKRLTLENAPWVMNCQRCNGKYPAEAPTERKNCPACGNMLVFWVRNAGDGTASEDPGAMMLKPEDFLDDERRSGEAEYSLL